MTDQQLLFAYQLGFGDCPDGCPVRIPTPGPLRIAYEIGWADYIIGDDVPSYDYRSSEVIVHEIRKAIANAA